MKTLIQNGYLYDGTGSKPVQADILMENERILRVGKKLPQDDAEIVDASGKAVTPGWIDIHRHCDLAALTALEFGEAELRQGLTSVVGGNCGLGVTADAGEAYDQASALIAPCLGSTNGLRFSGMGQYLDTLDQTGLRLNMGMLAAVGATKIAVKGFEKTPFTPQQMDKARALLREQLEEGALGVSLGIMYPPECYTTMEEYVQWLSVCAPFHRPMCCHIRGEGDSLTDSVREVIEIGRRAEIPVHISHFKCTGRKNWRKGIYRAIEEIERARAVGQDVTVDFYPYTAGATTLLSLLPPTVLEEDDNRLWDKAGTREGVKQIREALAHAPAGWDNMIDAIGYERILIANAAFEDGERLSGRNLTEAAEILGLESPTEAMCFLLNRTRGNTGVILQSMDENDLREVARLPYSLLISDALYGPGATHPRLYGAFPRAIRQMVCQKHVLTLEEAIRKMSYLPTKRIGLEERGQIREGMRADVLVFDPEKLQDLATYENPRVLSIGMEHVYVGGRDALTERTPNGTLLRK